MASFRPVCEIILFGRQNIHANLPNREGESRKKEPALQTTGSDPPFPQHNSNPFYWQRIAALG
jgi:hypothetical protein